MAIEKVTPNFLKHAPFPHSFTTILNDTIDLIPDDATLGIYVYLARKPEDWQIQEKDIMIRFSRGRDHVRKCLAILKKIGLLCKNGMRDEKGHITHWETILYRHITEKPSCGQPSQPAPAKGFNQITEKPSCGSIHITENPTSGKTHLLDNPTHTNNIYIQKKEELQNKELNPIGDSSNAPKKKIADYKKDERFMRFYSAYPRKEKPQDAWKAFRSIVGDDDDRLVQILEDVEKRTLNHSQWRNKQYIEYPASYLRAFSWEGEIFNTESQERDKKIQRELESKKRLAEQEEQSRLRHEREQCTDRQKNQDGRMYRAIVSEVKKGNQSRPSQEFKDMAKAMGVKLNEPTK